MDLNLLLESINQNINEGIYRSNEQGIIYVNKAFARMFGYESEDEVYSSKSLSLYKNPQERVRLISELKSKGAFENQEVTFLRKDGSEFIGLISSVIYTDEDGNVFWDGAIRDITEQREAVKQARRNSQFLESINKNINEAIYRSINRKGIIYVNDEFVRMFGYDSADEILNGDAINLYKDPEERRRLGDELVEKGEISNREVEFRKKDGSTFWGFLSSIKVETGDEDVFFDGAIRNINKQKAGERALTHQAAMQKLLVKISTRYINLPLDKVEESLEESLQELCEFVGADRGYIYDIDFARETISNTHEWCAKGIKPEIEKNQNLPISEIEEVLDTYVQGHPVVIDDVQEVPNEKYRKRLTSQDIKSIVSVPIMAGKYCVGFVGFDSVRSTRAYDKKEIALLKLFAELLLNIHTKSQNEKELSQLLITTTDQNKRLKDFSYITSHNIRSSVANLIGLTDVLQSDPGNPEYLSMLKQTTHKLSDAIDSINELLNFENEITVLKKENCRLSSIIENVIELNNQIIKERKIEINTSIDDSLMVRGFSAYLESIFHNIITNAIKYGTKEGSKHIEIKAKREGEEISVAVKDRGLGIDLDRFGDKLFRLGARFHSKEEQGQGLGLFMTKHQIEAMGGRIEIESEVNSGTTFKVFFNE